MTSNLTKTFLGTALAACVLIASASASHAVVLDTSALPDGDSIGGFFNGQTDLSTGITGPNLGITFSSDATNNVGFPTNPNATFTSAPGGGPNAITFGFGSGLITFANPFAYDVSFSYASLFGGDVLVNTLDGGQETIDLAANDPDDSSCSSADAAADGSLSFCTWTDANLDVDSPITSIDFSGANISAFADINVPEPASLALFATGVAAFGFYRRQTRA